MTGIIYIIICAALLVKDNAWQLLRMASELWINAGEDGIPAVLNIQFNRTQQKLKPGKAVKLSSDSLNYALCTLNFPSSSTELDGAVFEGGLQILNKTRFTF